MNPDDESLHDEEDTPEVGSDNLLAEDDLRLPEGANVLVRLHAVRAWLKRRQNETRSALGEAALEFQTIMLTADQEEGTHRRRREREQLVSRQSQAQHALNTVQERLNAYEEASALLEDSVTHTSGQRVLIEYYLALEELVHREDGAAERPVRVQTLAEVQQRIERVAAPLEDD